ncbi:hypothetical protein [Bacillus sp. 1P06AnD]|uniref:hypothetical protein n=1 Tax=Bacillus sp. 1P06AnD TaxID=3132208 RepID=UPI0039A187D8
MNEKNIRGITIDLDINNKVMVKKLNAISKHTKALADELDQIDKSVCPECGVAMETQTFYVENKVYHSSNECTVCDYREAIPTEQ